MNRARGFSLIELMVAITLAMIVTAGVFAEPMRKDHHCTRCRIGGPHVVHNPHTADAVEGVFGTGGCHQGQRRPTVTGST